MAQPSSSLSGAERIRSLQDEDAVFQAFDAYPWTKDKTFLSGLSAILGPPDSSNGSPADMAIHARIFYYAQRIGVQIDFAYYKNWLAKHTDHLPPQVLPEEYLSSKVEPLLPWQQAAPKADLYVDRKAAADAAAPSATSGDGQPSYPMGFAEMLKLLQEGKEIPGIRQIPNTVARDPSIKPVGARAAPKKPWEKDSPQEAPELSLPKALDVEFPPLESEPVEHASTTEAVAS
ncbi:hypothetical protein QQS21_003636 [Conoideocrella luteorostrata]|uniref:Uncharacterized protein n=1 Tax=Conoideocrella luteorostrata TaxID=1105319 RepID=A0AAJ0CSW7_9HYPO|nr:hypothetical protein QQS21_003636 [Conoideocrella luteorostrata]